MEKEERNFAGDLHLGTLNAAKNVRMINAKDKITEKHFIVMECTP